MSHRTIRATFIRSTALAAVAAPAGRAAVHFPLVEVELRHAASLFPGTPPQPGDEVEITAPEWLLQRENL